MCGVGGKPPTATKCPVQILSISAVSGNRADAARLLPPSSIEDLEVQMFDNQVARRDEKGIEAVAAGAMGEWLGQALIDQHARHDCCVEMTPSRGMRR